MRIENIGRYEKYNKMLSQIKDIIPYEKFLSYTDEVQEVFLNEFSNENVVDEYTTLNSKIRKFIPSKQFEKMSYETRDFLLKAKGDDLKDTQLLYLSKIPWGENGIDNRTIWEAKDILDKTHSGMMDVKERILEYIACQKRIGNSYGAILLLVGPPGVGKTSITSAIAEAMGRKFVKISLAGAADAEFLRGTNSIYSDSKPGRIIESIIKAGNFAPLILLDEIDKMGASTQHGSPEYALLDILDSERSNFVDDFLGIPIDLSQVIFIATANNINSMSPILLDRLEIIKLKGYTKKEKLDIIEKHLVPDFYTEYKLTENDVQVSHKIAEYIVDNFSNEPGIRSLEQLLRKIFESIVYYIDIGTIYNNQLTIGDVNQILGIQDSKKTKKVKKVIHGNGLNENIKKRDDVDFI